MINLTKKILILVMVLGLSFLIVSCSTGSGSEVTTDSDISEEVEMEPGDQEQVSEESEEQSSDTGETTKKEVELPEDVPLIPGYRKLTITSDGSNIAFEVDGSIENVVNFYTEELANLGWELSRSPDKTYSAFGAISRVKESGDRITISLQHNPFGDFVVVQMVVLRQK